MHILITGASSGIGRALATELVAQGHQVWGVARRRELLESLATQLGAERFRWSAVDVLNPASVDAAASQLRTAGFSPDAVVLNAGTFEEDLEPEYRYDTVQRVLATNVDGALIWVDRFLPEFRRRRAGQFVAISSVSAYRPDTTSVAYSASKAALSMAFRCLRLRYRTSGVRFKTIHFGPVATAISPRYSRSVDLQKKYWFVLTPQQAAAGIAGALSSTRDVFYIPFAITTVFRLMRILPDRWFAAITERLRRRE